MYIALFVVIFCLALWLYNRPKVKTLYKLEKLKEGDRIAMQYGFDENTFKVIWNSPDKRRIRLKHLFYGTEICRYDDYNFENYTE